MDLLPYGIPMEVDNLPKPKKNWLMAKNDNFLREFNLADFQIISKPLKKLQLSEEIVLKLILN